MANPTIRDYITESSKQNLSPDAVRSGFKETFNQNIDDYLDKLDTPLEQLKAPKPAAIAPEPKAVGIAGAPKMEFPAAREFGKELATGKTGKGLAIGEAIGAAFGAPTAGATIGAGIGKLLEPEPEVKAKPSPAARVETARAGAALGGALFGGPGALAGAALGAKFPAEEAAKYRAYEDFETQLKYLKATTPELREPVKAKEELEVEEPVIGVTRARRPKSRLTKSEAEKLSKWSSTDINEPPSAEVISMYQRVKGEDPRDVGALRKFRTEQAQEHQVGAFTPTEFKWAAPWDVARRATGALTGLARTGLGETKLTQRLEEPEVPDPDQPRPAEVDTSGMRMLDPAAQAESEQRKYQQRLWDEMQKDPKLAEKARRQWAPVYASRKARGAPLHGEGLPAVFETSKDEALLPERFRPFVEQVEKERRERQATTPQSVLYNFGLDLTTVIAATADMANKLIGAEPVPETPEVSTARAQLEKAKKSGDEDAIDEAESNLERISQEAIGAGLGMGLGGLPGQFTGLAGGLLDPSGRNVLLTNPFLSLMIAAPALKSLRAASPKFNNAMKAVETKTAKFIGAGVDYVFPGVRKSIKQKLVQYLANAIEVGDKERTAILDDIVVDPSRLKAMGEVLIRDAKSGKVPGLKDTELVEVELKYTPEPDVQAAKAAERRAAETGARAEAMGQAKEMAVESAQNIQKLNSNIRKLKKKAESVQKRIATAATEADRARLQKELADLQNKQRVAESRLATELRESRLRSKADIAAEDVMERGIELAEETESRANDNAIMRAMAEMERKQSAANEARARGVQTEDILRERADQIRARLEERERTAAGKAAVAGVEMAEGVKGIEDTEAAAQAARRAAAAPARFVAGAERAAKAAAAAAETAGERPEVSLGRIWVPREKLASAETTLASEVPVIRAIDPRSAEYLPRMMEEAQYRLKKAKDAYENPASAPNPEKLPLSVLQEGLKQDVLKAFDLVEQVQKAIDEQRTGEYRVFEEGGPRRLARLFEEVPATRRRAIEELAVKASDYKRQALEAGFDPNAPISAEAAKRIGVPEDATVYTAARRLAEHIDTIHADPTLVAEFLRQERLKAGGERAATKAGIAEAARWINAEIEAQNAATMIEPTYGAVRRPTPVVEAHELGVGGDVIAREEGKTQSLARALKPLTPGEELPTAEMNTLDRILDQMAEYSTKREAPKSVSVENTRFSQFMKEYADMVRQIGSTGEEIPAPRFDLETPDRPVPGEPFVNRWAKRELEAGRKLITPERIYQQILNTVLNDTVQLTLNSPKFRDYLMDLVDKRIKEAGFTGAERKKALIEVNKLISDPLRLSQHSKEKFPVVSHNGKPILKVDDFIQAAEKLDPKIVNEARANTIKATVEEQSRAAATYGTLHNIESEMNRFRFDADGKPRTLPNGAQAATRSAEGYAAQLAQSVVRDGETFPLITPYSGETIAQSLRIILNDANKDYRFNWNAQERQRLRELIDDVGRFESAQKAPKSKLVDSINGIFERTFKGTETKPIDFHNVHMHPAVLKALDSHFQDLLASETLDNLTSTLVGLTKAAQRNVVPMNVASLINNNLSNTLLQFLTRGSVNFLPNMVEATFKYTKFLEGDYQGLTPAEVRKFKAINRNAPVGHTQYANEITKSNWWQELKREKGLDVTKAGRMLRTAPEAFGKLRDAMTDMYSKYGDIPFRLEEMSHVYDKLNENIDTLEVGSSIDVEVTRNRNVRITKLSENKFQIDDMTGRQKPQIVGREDQMLADVLGANANVLQNRKMLNPKELGLWGKALQRAGLPLVSGIFTWYQGAMDIPFIKRGLVHELLFGGPFYETTSPAIMKAQALEYAGKALKRAITINSAQAAFLDQRKLRNVRHSLGYNPSLEATLLADASNPAYVSIRNLDPLMFGTPTVNTLNGIANLFEAYRFTPAFNDPLFYAKTMNADRDWANMSDKQIDSYPPEVAKYGRELKELSKTDPRAYEDRALIQRDLIRWGSGQISDVGQFFRTLGLAGGPLLNWLFKTSQNKWSFEEAGRKFFELVIGVTPARAIDVAAGALGEAGFETAGRYSSYGTDLARSGFHSKSETTPDESTLLDWALRQLLGIGWKQAFYGTGKEKADDVRGVPMLKSYIKRFTDAMNDSFKNSLRRDARKVLGANATDEQVEEQAKKSPYFDLMNKGLKNTIQKTLMTLNQEKAALDESRREYPAPSE